MEIKTRCESWQIGNLLESNTFGFFDCTGWRRHPVGHRLAIDVEMGIVGDITEGVQEAHVGILVEMDVRDTCV